jgi:transposase-like protein
MATDSLPKTLLEAIRYFTDYENCYREVVNIRWPNGKVTCPTCGSEKVTWLANARVFKCYAKHPKAKFSLKVGTIFEDSPLGFDKWLPAMWMLTNCKNGISSYELGRALGVTQKTAWFMLSRLRLVLQDENDGGKLNGEIEIDETYIGGKARNMHKAKRERVIGGHKGGVIGKTAVMGLLQRHSSEKHSTVRLKVVKGVKREHLIPQIDANVEKLTTVYTDALPSYEKLSDREYTHHVIDHAEKYAEGQVHVNGLENFWSLLKRALKGTYVSVQPFHLFRYLDEQAYRFNNRKADDATRFTDALRGVVGKRLMYSTLIQAKVAER